MVNVIPWSDWRMSINHFISMELILLKGVIDLASKRNYVMLVDVWIRGFLYLQMDVLLSSALDFSQITVGLLITCKVLNSVFRFML